MIRPDQWASLGNSLVLRGPVLSEGGKIGLGRIGGNGKARPLSDRTGDAKRPGYVIPKKTKLFPVKLKAVSMIALIAPAMIAVIEPRESDPKAISDGFSN
jgi:hypothetical protein